MALQEAMTPRPTTESTPFLALVGTPNSGKSTLFNALTGLRQKVGNFPGVTVEPKQGFVQRLSTPIRIVDLPGLYSFEPSSRDEEFAVAVLEGRNRSLERPDRVAFVIDGTNLEKGLTLFAQFASLGIPCVVVVTMIDAIKAQGAVLDDISLERALGVKVFGVVGSKGLGVEAFREQLERDETWSKPNLQERKDVLERVAWARQTSALVLDHHNHDALTVRLDRVLLHPVWGGLSFACIMALFFIAIFQWADPLMQLIQSGVEQLRLVAENHVQQPLFRDFLSNGVLAGVGSVLVFLPQIFILMVVITALEDCGYLARAAFIVDRIMGIFGLQGRSFIPLLGSFACAIPGIISARIISSHKDRMTTILIAPLMTCSARLPVYALLISAFIPASIVAGVVPLQSLVMAGLYGIGLGSGLLVALVVRKTVFRSEPMHFLIEFPPYRVPTIRNVLLTVWERSQDFLKTAGTVILGISIVLWFLSAFPRYPLQPQLSSLEMQQAQLEHSYAGMIGKTIQPVFQPCGFDWKTTVGIVGSFAARETFISVMAQMYATDVSSGDVSLQERLRHSMSLPAALSVLAFYIFALQCMSTVAVIRRETGSWIWSAVAFAYTFVLAYLASFLTFHVSSAFL